jgi:hypothetical protein
MATVTRIYKVDDLDGSEDGVSTVEFGLDGADYEIDLSPSNADRLREKLARYVDAGTPVTPQKPRQPKRAGRPVSERMSPEQTHAIRQWAKENGYEVSLRGRISKTIHEAFEAAH